ncbi:NAD(P)/FAD-dependent oxidoreductase [Sporosarcina gallistercoris]|uniref:Ferredoxin--NADP reductase n=1 Tax=Sporosarcina gallistercoris TaxID=2762245 RepID=A0ABR8PEZ1_9BACL|nr:NAD(P)/FAD-dependent oxidoreductase [Sporosarcina gallistercoris]MBD7906743.1 NAD(P)/FAD-dependent oxidoreductase [Sporosarcina gallistercoris]
MSEATLVDVTIIGGGPAGLYAAFYSGLRGMSTKIIEFQPELGGKLHVYQEKMIWDIGGVTPAPAAHMIDKLVEQGMTFNPEVVLNEKVTGIEKNEDGHFVLTGSSGTEHYSRTVILAVGSGILKPQKVEIEGAERFEVSNLHYTVKSLQYFKGKRVLISGGGNAAIDWANELEPIAEQVILTYRKCDLNGHEAQVQQLLQSKVMCHFNTRIDKLIASNDHHSIEKVELKHCLEESGLTLEVDDVVINHGYEVDTSLIGGSDAELELTNDHRIAGTPMSGTSVPGIFAAGDVLFHESKVNLIAGAFQDAANAVNSAKMYLDPKASQAGMVSSHNEVFKQRNKKLVEQLIK